MVHDCSLTESSVVIYDLPCVFDLELAMSGKSLPYRWDPEYPARLGVLPRDGDAADVRWYDIEPCYVFHPLNAYDDGDRIVLDVVRHPKMFAANQLGPNEGKPTLDRWTIDTSAGKVLEERIDDRGQEFPRVDERVVGRRHRFGYSVGATQDSKGDVDLMDDTVLKHDMVKGTTQAATFASGASAGEFVFVPREAGAAEDDGVLMGFVHRSETDRSDLVLLDAATLETVAEIHLPARVPHGFHGNWIPT
jgi:carotenoid cleavage dioxygenase